MSRNLTKPGGYASWTGPMGIVRECDTFTCVHCNGIVFVGVIMVGAPEKEPDLGGFCLKCNAPICGGCAGKDCRPFGKWLERMESATTARLIADRQYAELVKGSS